MDVVMKMSGEERWAGMDAMPLGLAIDYYSGKIQILDVRQRSPAHLAGLKKGDRVVGYEGTDQPTNAKDFREYLKSCWEDLRPALLRVEKKTHGRQGGRPKKETKPASHNSEKKIVGFWKDPEATRDAIRERLCLFRQTQAEAAVKIRGAYDEWEKRREAGEWVKKWWVEEAEAREAEAVRDIVALAAHLSDYGMAFLSTLAPPNVSETGSQTCKLRAAHELTAAALRAAHAKRQEMSLEDRRKVDKDMDEMERRRVLSVDLCQRVRSLLSSMEHDVVALTAGEVGPFREALTRIFGFNLAGSHFSFDGLDMAVKSLSAYCDKDSMTYFHVELEGRAGAVMEATLVRVPLGEGGKVAAGLGGPCEDLFHSALAYRKTLDNWWTGLGDADTPAPSNFTNPHHSSHQ